MLFAILITTYLVQGIVAQRNFVAELSVPNGGQWGYWRNVQYCPRGQYAVGFDMKIEDYQFTGDDSGLNGVTLTCSGAHGEHFGETTITSGVGPFGSMKGPVTCNQRPGKEMFLVAFSLEVESNQGSHTDDTAANWIRFECRDMDGTTNLEQLDKDPGTSHVGTASYGAWSATCPAHSAICGIQTKVEDSQGSGDDTALNDVKFFCCDKNEGSAIG